MLTQLYAYIHTYITLHYITLHCITLHCIALHCITLHYIHTYMPTYMCVLYYIYKYIYILYYYYIYIFYIIIYIFYIIILILIIIVYIYILTPHMTISIGKMMDLPRLRVSPLSVRPFISAHISLNSGRKRTARARRIKPGSQWWNWDT